MLTEGFAVIGDQHNDVIGSDEISSSSSGC